TPPPTTLAEFITSFNSYFLHHERKGKVQQALHTFKQSGNMDSYTQQFNVHAYDSAWSDDILVSLYRGGLKDNIQLAIPHFQNQPTNSTTATNPNAMDLSAMKGRLSDSECLVIYLETAQRRRNPANLPHLSASLTYRC
ncbi:hypothetical protein VP01_11068g1, partial [Puccinia sorghi]